MIWGISPQTKLPLHSCHSDTAASHARSGYWKAVKQQQAEVVVGPAVIATELNRLFPQLTQWALARGN